MILSNVKMNEIAIRLYFSNLKKEKASIYCVLWKLLVDYISLYETSPKAYIRLDYSI